MIPALKIMELATGECVKRVDVSNPTPRKVEQVLTGMLHRIDTDRFYVDDSEFDAIFAAKGK